MDAFKIENYEREHGAGTFIPFRHLSESEADQVLHSFKERLHLPVQSDYGDISRFIFANSFVMKDVDAESEEFDLDSIVRQLRFDAADLVYLNWYRFDKIDELRFVDLCEKFDDIWYPSSDDLDVFDRNMNWLISVEHSGSIRALRIG